MGDDCWIGDGATIIADVGNKYVVAGGGVVVNSFPDRMIVVGNPVLVTKERQ